MAKINKRFQDYIDGKNYWNRITKQGDVVEFPLSQKNVDYLGNCLSSDLSPENLACDGEIRGAKLRSKANKLNGVVKDIEKYCDANNLHYPRIFY